MFIICLLNNQKQYKIVIKTSYKEYVKEYDHMEILLNYIKLNFHQISKY